MSPKTRFNLFNATGSEDTIALPGKAYIITSFEVLEGKGTVHMVYTGNCINIIFNNSL